jgi:alkylhydroperoxidase family enzyme
VTAIRLAPLPDDVAQEVEPARHFDEQQRVELTVTAGFYAMVPRVLEALGVPVEDQAVVRA